MIGDRSGSGSTTGPGSSAVGAAPDPEAGLPSTVTVGYRVRFDECGPDGLARSSALLRHAQDIAWIHSERLGFDRAWYAERGLAWLVRAVELVVLDPPGSGEELLLTTRPAGFRRVRGRRSTVARRACGTEALRLTTDWVMTDASGRPGLVPPAFVAALGIDEAPFEPLRVDAGPVPEGAFRLAAPVRPAEVDPMGHMNNAAYVDRLEEAVDAAGGAADLAALPRTIRVEYALPAAPGSLVEGAVWRSAAGWAWRLLDGSGRELARATLDSGTGPER